MAITNKTITAGALSSSPAPVYTAAFSSTASAKITSLTAYASGGIDQLNIHIVRSGDSLTSDNLFFSRDIADGETRPIPLVNQVLKNGDTIQAYTVTGGIINLTGAVREET